MSDPLAAALDAEDVEKAELRTAVFQLQQRLISAEAKREAIIQAVEQAARQAAVIVGRPEIRKPAKDKRASGGEVALIHATDWQGGKRTEDYSTDVLADRISVFADKIHRITEMQRADHPVRKAVLMLGGDMVEGLGIFPGQAHEVDSTLYEQFFTVAKIVEQLVVDLLGQFDDVDVWCEWGNHGRIGRKGDLPAHDNIDLFLYRMVAERFQGNDRVTWHYSTNWYQLVEVGNYRALLFHGDEIKSFGGNTPAFGILRKVTSWASGVIEPFDDAYGGHFHTPMTMTLPNGAQIYMTGSPESHNAYAAEFVAARGKPSQRLHFVDPDAGRVTASYIVWLD